MSGDLHILNRHMRSFLSSSYRWRFCGRRHVSRCRCKRTKSHTGKRSLKEVRLFFGVWWRRCGGWWRGRRRLWWGNGARRRNLRHRWGRRLYNRWYIWHRLRFLCGHRLQLSGNFRARYRGRRRWWRGRCRCALRYDRRRLLHCRTLPNIQGVGRSVNFKRVFRFWQRRPWCHRLFQRRLWRNHDNRLKGFRVRVGAELHLRLFFQCGCRCGWWRWSGGRSNLRHAKDGCPLFLWRRRWRHHNSRFRLWRFAWGDRFWRTHRLYNGRCILRGRRFRFL